MNEPAIAEQQLVSSVAVQVRRIQRGMAVVDDGAMCPILALGVQDHDPAPIIAARLVEADANALRSVSVQAGEGHELRWLFEQEPAGEIKAPANLAVAPVERANSRRADFSVGGVFAAQ